MSTLFEVNLEQTGRKYPHYWEQCVGSCHAATLLREDVRGQIRRAHEECGFQYIRFHGLFDDDMSVVIKNFYSTHVTYSFFNIDSVFDFLLSIGMKPFIEIGFMPEALASSKKTGFHYKNNITMPKHDEEWVELIRLFTLHLIERYGKEEVRSWFFEVWNEPNLGFFFKGTRSDYFHLYEITSETIKEIDAQLKVGGPATSSNAWILEFREFCEKNQVPLDFITTHHYPNDDPFAVYGESNETTGIDMETELSDEMKASIEAAMTAGIPTENPRDILYQMTKKAKEEAGKYPLYYTEWNGSVEHDTNYMAAFVTHTLAHNENMVEGYSFWTVSDIFEEMGQLSAPFHDGFGMLTLHNIAKPVYHVFKELHLAGDNRLAVQGVHDTVECLVLAEEQNKKVTVFLYNHDIARKNVKTEEIQFKISGSCQSIEMAVIDEKHCNPKKKWEELGAIEYPTKETLDQIEKAAVMKFLPAEPNQENVITISAEPESVTILHICR